MRIFDTAKVLAVLFIGLFGKRVLCDDKENLSSWGWTCNANTGLCERSYEPIDFQHPSDINYVPSLKLCRLTCGQYGALWPKPSGYTFLSKEIVPFDLSKFKFNVIYGTTELNHYLKTIQLLFLKKLERECGDCDLRNENSVTVSLTHVDHSTTLLQNTDESYLINTTYNKDERNAVSVSVNITARTIFGIRHGLETLSQLITSNKTTHNQTGTTFFIIRANTIIDKPSFKHRGLLIDTSRNFLSVKTIKRQIDAMGISKLNVLHWHATDTQSFPIVFPSVPQLASYGAYSPEQTYNFTEIKDLVNYAKYRGVRIIMEIDAPSHAGNGWQFGNRVGLGDLAVCINRTPWRDYCIQPPCGQLNPVNRNVYTILGKLFNDLAKVFPKGELFHMGGDELFIPCWNSTEEIVNFMINAGMGRTIEDFIEIWGQYQAKSLAEFDKSNQSPKVVIWSSTLTEPNTITKYLDKSRYIVQTWVKSDDILPMELLTRGYELIMSTKDAWYLDHGFWGSTTYYTWRRVFENKIINNRNVLGGEVCMWGEYVDDNSIDTKVWPRAAAAAERLWTNSYKDTSRDVESRFYSHRERLVESGVRADAVTPEWCVQNEGFCK